MNREQDRRSRERLRGCPGAPDLVEADLGQPLQECSKDLAAACLGSAHRSFAAKVVLAGSLGAFWWFGPGFRPFRCLGVAAGHGSGRGVPGSACVRCGVRCVAFVASACVWDTGRGGAAFVLVCFGRVRAVWEPELRPRAVDRAQSFTTCCLRAAKSACRAAGVGTA